MTMILQLLVAAVAVGLGVDARSGTPPYKEYVQAIEEASGTLEKNMLSMEGNIPLLNDYRRHYAEIIHVVNYHAISESGCVISDYYESYPKVLNSSAPQAINQPEEVLKYIREIQVDFRKYTDELKQLIDACVQQSEVCNELIDDTVQANEDQYGGAAQVFIAAGLAATKLNKLNGKFEDVSKDLRAHQYVCTTPQDLEQIVRRVANLHRQINFRKYRVDAVLHKC